MPTPVDDADFHLGYWRELLASEASKPAARHKVPVDDLVQEALVRLWQERDRWKWPPDPAKLRRLLYRLAREITGKVRRDARRRNHPPRPRQPCQVPLLCKRLRELLARVRKPWQYEGGILTAAMEIAPAELRDGRFREADFAWRQHKPLRVIATDVAVAKPSILSKRLVRASETLERGIFDAIRNALTGPAQRILDAYRRKVPLADPELNALAEEVASVLEGLYRADDTDSDGPGMHLG